MPRKRRPRIHPPQQPRSEATVQRIGEAMVTMLRTRPLDQITIPELCRKASASISSFYARFSDRNALLAWLDEHYLDESRRTMGELLDPARWQGRSLATMVRELMQAYVAFLREHAPVLRGIALANRSQPGSHVSTRSRELNLLSYERIVALLATRRDEIRHPRPKFALQLGLTAVYALSHELILFADARLHPLELSDEQVARVLAETYLAILNDQGAAAHHG